MNNDELLIRAVVSKICQDTYKICYLKMLKQWGEMNDNFNDGLRHFVSKLYSKYDHKMDSPQSNCLRTIYTFFTYRLPLKTNILQNYLEGN